MQFNESTRTIPKESVAEGRGPQKSFEFVTKGASGTVHLQIAPTRDRSFTNSFNS